MTTAPRVTGSPSRTPQHYDPLGALGSRPLAVVLGGGAVLWALWCSFFGRDVPGSAVLSVVTVLLLAGSVAVLVAASSPFRAPFPRPAYVTHVLLLAAATITSVAAQWGPDRDASNDFMAIATATGILAAAPYRPWRDLLVGGVLLAAVDGATWGVAASVFRGSAPVPVVVFLAAAPTLVMMIAAVVFAWTFVGLAERVQIRAGSYSVERAERDGIARSVQQDRATILGRDVAPFFAELRTRDRVTDADRERARAISDGIRQVMVADAERTWITQAVRADGGDVALVEDPHGLAATMDAEQRTVVRTVIRAALRARAVEPDGVRITVGPARPPAGAEAAGLTEHVGVDLHPVAAQPVGAVRAARGSEPRRKAAPRVSMRIDIAAADTEAGIHRTFDPYLAVLRVTFPDLEAVIRPSSLALRFSHDQH